MPVLAQGGRESRGERQVSRTAVLGAVSCPLRGNAATRHIPVIVVTGTDTANLDRSEFACVLEKPVSADELVDAVHNCLNRWRQ
jgi:hypothetical protein